jgi:guanine nucleotide-binding protein subunit alpha
MLVICSLADIIRARLKTITVEELYFVFEKGSDPGRDCFLIDVGGSRSHVCLFSSSYYVAQLISHRELLGSPISMMVSFAHLHTTSNSHRSIRKVNAILFLAPLAFNKTLEEDPQVNRLVRVHLDT